jgi:hypothetical protein
MSDGYEFGLSQSVGPYGNNIDALVQQIKSSAANIQTGANPAYGVSDFLNIFPQFGPEVNDNYQDIIQMFIDMANSSLQYGRWQSKWKYGMSLYVAHFYTLYLETQAGFNQTLGQVVASASAQFPKSSKSVGDVSVSYDVNSITSDLPGWGAWKSTTFGIQFASIARLLGRGGMYVW